MATIDSLGFYEPNALRYLISEGILPTDPQESSYHLSEQLIRGQDGTSIRHEILRTTNCAVWSQEGLIKRVYNLDFEGEPLLHAFVTTFWDKSSSPYSSSGSKDEYGDVVDEKSKSRSKPQSTPESAFVVILKTQAQIFLLSGDVHVIPISFEVERAFPCGNGFVLQAKNTRSRSARNRRRGHAQALLSISNPEAQTSKLEPIGDALPRTFCVTELLSEMGLVAAGSVRSQNNLDECPPLPAEETILYLSTESEVPLETSSQHKPVFLAVTHNTTAAILTIWQVVFRDSGEEVENGLKARQRPTRPSRRKSSNVYGRQASGVVSSLRGPKTFRESFGGESKSAQFEPKRGKVEDLMTQLGHEFEQSGVQTRSARRVSSMMARTDLGGAYDRTAFNDMALTGAGRKSLSRSMRRGESIGSFGDRLSLGSRRRSSFQMSGSVMSNGTSLLGAPTDSPLDDLHIADILQEISPNEAVDHLVREVGFMKLKSVPCSLPCARSGDAQSVRVSTLLSPATFTGRSGQSRILSVCLMDLSSNEVTTVNIQLKASSSFSKSKMGAQQIGELKVIEVQKGTAVADACRVMDHGVERLLVLSQSTQGHHQLYLEAPWSPTCRVEEPLNHKLNPNTAFQGRRKPSVRRTIDFNQAPPEREARISRFLNSNNNHEVVAIDSAGGYHRWLVSLRPSTELVNRIIQMYNFVLPADQHDSLLVAFWDVKTWLEAQDLATDAEWTALAVALFLMAVPFISTLQSKPAPGERRRKSTAGRSGGVSFRDTDGTKGSAALQATRDERSWKNSPAWSWAIGQAEEARQSEVSGKLIKSPTRDKSENDQDIFLVRCTNLARDFMQSPAGESATGTEGYLPTAIGKDRGLRRTALATVVVGLHMIREEQKLDTTSLASTAHSSDELALLIVQLAAWLGWSSWRATTDSYFGAELSDPARWVFEASKIDLLDVPREPFPPPSIFLTIESCLKSCAWTFPNFLDIVHRSGDSAGSDESLQSQASQLTPRTIALTAFATRISSAHAHEDIVEAMRALDVDEYILHTLPTGVAAPFHHAIHAISNDTQSTQAQYVRHLLGIGDLEWAMEASQLLPQHVSRLVGGHGATRDYRSIVNSTLDADGSTRAEGSSETDRQAITRLFFHEDRRFQEASRLLNQTRPPVVDFVAEPGWTEANLLDAQKELAQRVTKRTLSVAAGRGMMHYNSRSPLLTERVAIPAFSLQCVMKSTAGGEGPQPMIFSADRAMFTEEKVCWAFFHNGVSAGLMVSRDAKWLDTSWIQYNKPAEVTNRNAGFLLALGLNGHLKSLAKWVAFRYLTPKHTMTSIGLLLGLAASYIGTADTSMTRLLSVHVTRLLPAGAAELNLSPLTQTTGLIGIGLLYCELQHRRMSEVMLSEIENDEAEEQTGDEPILRDEGYRLAAGFSLGLINLGHGHGLHALHDMAVVSRLLTIAVGTRSANMVHIRDRATAGAVVALAFIFMKTNDAALASRIDVPDTLHQFVYVRPDVFLLRTLARHLIMWDAMRPTRTFVQESLPAAYRNRADLSSIKRLSTDDLPLLNILGGICFALALRFAGSQRADVRDLLVSYLDQFWRLCRLPAPNYDSRVTLSSVRHCLDVVALSAAAVMAGSGDIVVLRRLRALHGRNDGETPFGSHLAAHMAIGALFLSGGTATFGTSKLAVASLVVAFYPSFPVDVLDNRGHLQALRHLWVLAVEARCLIARDSTTKHVIGGVQADLRMMDGSSRRLRTPCLLPPLGDVHTIAMSGDGYWKVTFDLNEKDERSKKSLREIFQHRERGINLFLRRQDLYEKPDIDAFTLELHALDEARGIPSVDANAPANERWTNPSSVNERSADHSLDWMFESDILDNLDPSEKALLIGDGHVEPHEGPRLLRGSVLDTRLDLEAGLTESKLSPDRLWQLRLLFAWSDHMDEEEQMSTHKGAWLREEVIEKLRGRVWQMSGEAATSTG